MDRLASSIAENPDATIFALQDQLISLRPLKNLSKSGLVKHKLPDMSCIDSDVFMMEPDAEIKTSQPKQWQIIRTNIYTDKNQYPSLPNNCSQQCTCSSRYKRQP